MTKLKVVATVIALLAEVVFVTGRAVLSRGVAQPVAPPGSPNVVEIVTDDQAFDTLDSLPYLTSLPGGHWTEFIQAVDTEALCCPDRATLLTGQIAARTGVFGNGSGDKFKDADTVATDLHNFGYRTGLIGRYLNGYPFGSDPYYLPPGWDTFLEGYGYYDWDQVDAVGRTTTHYGSGPNDYEADVLARRAAEFIQSPQQAPFFLYLATKAPHTPFDPPTRYRSVSEASHTPPNYNESDVTDKPAWVRGLPKLTTTQQAKVQSDWANAKRALLAVNDLVQTVVTALQGTGQFDNTVILFVTDNGLSQGSHRWRTKICEYEECVRTHLFVRDPIDTGANQTSAATVGTVDMTPTILDLAQAPTGRRMDGVSFRSLLGGTTSFRDGALINSLAPGTVTKYYGVRTASWKYVELKSGERELYDLTADPYELDNVADRPAYATTQAQMKAKLVALEPNGQPCWTTACARS